MQVSQVVHSSYSPRLGCQSAPGPWQAVGGAGEFNRSIPRHEVLGSEHTLSALAATGAAGYGPLYRKPEFPEKPRCRDNVAIASAF